MIDPKFNKLPADEADDLENVPESELSPEQRAARLRKPRPGMSINDTIARDANLSVGSRGVDTTGMISGSGAGAGLTSVTPGEGGESPAPNVVPVAPSSGTTPRGSTGPDQSPTTRLGSSAEPATRMGPGSEPATRMGAGSEPATRMGPGSEPGTRQISDTEPTRDEIAARAYRCWHERGCPEGTPEEDWHRAEQELRRERQRSTAASA
jgi:hypothetical protein